MISKDSDQTVQMHRLIKVFTGRTSLVEGFVLRWLKSYFKSVYKILYENAGIITVLSYSC